MEEASGHLCRTCGECCSDNVRFFKSDIDLLETAYPDRFKFIELISDNEHEFRLRQKGSKSTGSGEEKCLFFNLKTMACDAYEHRPLICRLYGQSPIASCGYDGLDRLPDESFERFRLSAEAKQASLKRMVQLAAGKE